MRTVIRVSCIDQQLKAVASPLLASGGLNEAVVAFDFCEKWDGFAKTGVFYRDEEDVYYSLLDENDECIIPHEVYDEPGTFYFTVFGDKDSIRRTASTLRYKAYKGVVGDAMKPSDPTPDVYDQIMAKLNGYDGGSCVGVMSAEQIAALDGMFNVCAYIKDDVSTEYEAFKIAFGLNGSGGGDSHTHSYTSSVTKAATCTTAGVLTYTCSCGHSYTEPIPATGHNYVDGVCSVCGATDPNHGSSGGDDQHNHVYASEVTKAATCTTEGIHTYTCSCGHTYTEPIPATGHNYVDGVCVVCGSGGESGEGGTDDAPTTLETYTVFVPQNVSDEWKVTGGNGTLRMSDTEFLELFYDGFVSAPPSGVTVYKNSIGKDESGQYDMLEYDFCPTNYNRTILLSSGMHTYELSASFGLANFIGHLYTDTGNDAFDYIRNNVRIKVIPIVNPWGFNQYPKTYGNMNGVNPNRNFDLNGEWAAYPVYTPSQNEWNVKGAYPFSEAEVHNLARWAESNWNAEFWIDCHTGEGYADKDLWVYYSSDSAILNRINGAISKIETWFIDAYGKHCVTTRTIDNPDSIRLHWAEKIAGIAGMTLEQAPQRTTFGTSATNEAADISNYSTNISTFVQELLLEKYRDDSVVNIESVTASDITITSDELSKTVEATIKPTNTTQNHFKWESSNPSIIDVYGGTNKAVLVNKGTGSATITLTNRYNPSIKTNFVVTSDVKDSTRIGVGLRAIDTITGKVVKTSTNRILSDMIPVESGEISVEVPPTFYVKAFVYDRAKAYFAENSYIGGFDGSTISGNVPDGYVRLLIKKADNSDITESEMLSLWVEVNGTVCNVEATDEGLDATIVAGIRGINTADGSVIEHTARILTDIIPAYVDDQFVVTSDNGYFIKLFFYDSDGTHNGKTIGGLNTASVKRPSTGWTVGGAYFRILLKKPDGSDFTVEEFNAATISLGSNTYHLI